MKRKKASKVVTFFTLGILSVVWIVPIVWAVFTSFKTETEIKTGGFGFIPKEWTMENYIEIFTNTDNAPILRWFGNSMIIAVSVTVLTVILVAVTNIFLVRQFSLAIPREFDEAAKIDGAGEFAVFARVILPMLKPVLTVVGLFAFTGSWNDFLWPTIVFNDVEKMPLTAGLQLLNGAYGSFQLGPILAAACVAILPTFLLYLFAQKYFLQSMALHSGVKG